MKEYDVTITETLQKTVTVEAPNKSEAEGKVTDAWNREDYVLGAEDFVGVDIKATDEREIEKAGSTQALLVQPNAYPKAVTIGTELEELQAIVGGNIEVTYPFEEEVGLIMNEEGKLNGLPLNRALRTDDGDIYDIIAGDFLVVGLTEDSFGSLSTEQMERYEKLFHQPEMFVRMGRSIMAMPLPDEMVKGAAERADHPPEAKAKPAPDRESL